MLIPTQKAYAKLVGPNWVHYMLKHECVLGRSAVSADVALMGDVSISRRHVLIRFSAELQAYEISVLGRNGIFVNGSFMKNGEQPRILSSHTDLIIGRNNPSLVTFYLPRQCTENRDISTTNSSNSLYGNSNGNNNAVPNMVTMVGTLLIRSDVPLTAPQIYTELLKTRVRVLETLGSKSVIESSIRGAITGNPHIFETHSAYNLTKQAELCGVGNGTVYKQAGFSVRKDYRLRFLKDNAAEFNGSANDAAANGQLHGVVHRKMAISGQI